MSRPRQFCFAFWAWRLLQWPAMCKDPVRKYGLSLVRNSRPFLSRASAKTAKKNAMSPTRITQCLKEQMFTSAWNWTIPVTRVREDCAATLLTTKAVGTLSTWVPPSCTVTKIHTSVLCIIRQILVFLSPGRPRTLP